MTMSPHADPIPRIPSRIPGLDTLLYGGFRSGGIYMVGGRPGAGKTILGNQICFEHVANGGKALYVTLLTESHARLIASLQQLSFFNPSRIANSLWYLSAYQALEGEGLDGLLNVIRGAIREHGATLLVLDGLVNAQPGSDDLALKRFIHDLQVLIELVGCTTLLLTGARDSESNYAERTMVDGLLHLSSSRVGMRTVRELEVLKHRGSANVLGTHFFEISDKGIRVHPRIESVMGRGPIVADDRPAAATGIRGLDAMLGGGLSSGSTTLLLGAPGSGKTTVGLNFLAEGAKQDERGLYVGFYEQPGRLIQNASRTGLDLGQAVDSGLLELMHLSPLEQVADALAFAVLDAVRRGRVRRLFIDGLGAFRNTIVHRERLTEFLMALNSELRAHGVTTVLSELAEEFIGPPERVEATGAVDNVLFLRYVELRSQLRRLVSILKMNGGDYDSSIREFTIQKAGVRVESTFRSAEAVLSGLARTASSPTARLRAATKRGAGGKRRGPK